MPLAAQSAGGVSVATAEQQIAAAVLPLPEPLRAGATVLGYGAGGRLTTLRQGTGTMICLADDPAAAPFHVACYSASMDAFMARGRELRSRNVAQNTLDSLREADVREGRIRMPAAAMLYSLSGPAGSWDPATGVVRGARPLFVVYVPFATAESIGLSAVPARGTPWIMHAGQANAHIMFVPDM